MENRKVTKVSWWSRVFWQSRRVSAISPELLVFSDSSVRLDESSVPVRHYLQLKKQLQKILQSR